MDADRTQLEDAVVSRVCELLTNGPQSIEGLAFALEIEGVFAPLQSVVRTDLSSSSGRERYLGNLLETVESMWRNEDDPLDLIHRCDLLFGGRVLTHRLTEREVRGGVLLGQLETTGHDVGIAPDDRPFGGEVHRQYDSDALEVTWAGPDGWFGELPAGELLAVVRDGASFRVEAVAPWELTDGRSEIAALAAIADTLTPGVSYDDFDLLPKAFAADATAFTQATLPLPELMGRAGLELRSGFYGLAGKPWNPPGNMTPDRNVEEIAERFALESCCRESFEALITVWLDLRVDPSSVGRLDYRDVAEHLSHGSVALAFEGWATPIGVLDGEPYLAFLYNVAAVDLPSAAGAHHLLARSFFRKGEVLSGVRALERSHVLDAGYVAADVDMASVEFMLGDFAKSRRRLERLGFTADDAVMTMYPDVGFDEALPPRDALFHKATHYLRSDACRSQVTMASILAFGAHPRVRGEEEVSFVMDLVLHEGGVLEQFLQLYRPLLSDAEVTAGGELRRSVRELFEVVASSGEGVDLRRVVDGAMVAVSPPSAPMPLDVGQHILARTLRLHDQHVIDGSVVRVEPWQRRVVLDVLDLGRREPGAAMRELLDWYARLDSTQFPESSDGAPGEQ